MQISDLETPVPVVDFEIVHSNIRRLQHYCDANEIKLRPHIKTHKLPLFAHEQTKAGAIGITVQKLGEAEAMAQTGIDDILLTFNVIGQAKAERLARVTNFARMSVGVDNEKSLESVKWAAKRAPSTPAIPARKKGLVKPVPLLIPALSTNPVHSRTNVVRHSGTLGEV